MTDTQGEYHLDLTINGEHRVFTQTARTAHEAETLVRRRLNRDIDVVSYRFDLIRGITYAWNGDSRYDAPVVRIPESFNWTLFATHRRR